MAITTADGLIAAFASAPLFRWNKVVMGGTSQGVFFSMWCQPGNPVGGAIPTTAETCTSSMTGAVPFTNPTAPALTYLGYFTFENIQITSQQELVHLKDRLSHMGGLSGISTGSQTVGLSIPANRLVSADCTNAEWFVECYVTLGSTPQTLTVTYVNTASVTHTVDIAIPASLAAGRLIRIIPSTAGDVIQSITSCQLGGSTGTAGNFGFTCARHVLESGLAFNPVDVQDAISTGMTQVADSSCLWFSIAASVDGWLGAGSNGSLKLIQG